MKKRLLRDVGENYVSATESYDSCFTEKHAFLEKGVSPTFPQSNGNRGRKSKREPDGCDLDRAPPTRPD